MNSRPAPADIKAELCWLTVARRAPGRPGSVPPSLEEHAAAGAAGGFASIATTAEACLDAGGTAREILARDGITVGYIDALSLGQSSRSFELQLDAALRAAALVDSPMINLHDSMDPPTPPGVLTDRVARAVARCRGEGRAVCLEFVPNSGIPDFDAAVRLLDAAAPAGAGVLFDTWHHFRGAGRLDTVPSLAWERVVAAQVSDMPLARVNSAATDTSYRHGATRLPPGAGVLPLAQAIDCFHRVNLAAPIGLELVGDGWWGTDSARQLALRGAQALAALTENSCEESA